MGDWSECAHIYANNAPGQLGGVTSVRFDPYSELVWAGSASGQVTSHFGPELQRYTSYAAHGTPARPVPTKTLLLDERHVYSVGEGGIHCASRKGLAKWGVPTKAHTPSLTLQGMTMSPLASSSELIAGGASVAMNTTGTAGPDDVLLVVNRNSGSVVRKVASDAAIAHICRSSRMVCIGSTGGHIQMRDPRSLSIEHRLHAHPGGLIDLAADGNLVYSIGWTMRLGHPVAEPLVKVHDVRTMRALVPIPFAAPGGPGLVRVHPKLSSTVVVAAPQGHFQIVDTGNPGEGVFNQVQTSSYITCLDISPSGDFLAFGEADGAVRLWSSSPDTSAIRFNNFECEPPEAADLPEEMPTISWTPTTPLSTIGLPYYAEPLLSCMSYDHYGSESSLMFRPAAKIDSVVLSTMRNVDGVGYAPLPKHLRGKRNVVLDRTRGKDRRRIGMPLFRSEQEREAAKGAGTKKEAPSSPVATLSENEMPAYYQVQNIQYSKFGIEDFDFGFYNKTEFSGLETHIQNSYANAYLQTLNYLTPIRTLAKSHIAQDCQRENCLLCEAGFLFKMLETARGGNCQATNFLRAFGNLPRTAVLGLLDQSDSPSADAAYANLAQNLNRYMLDTMSAEADLGGENLFRKAVAIAATTRTTCGTCGATSEREAVSFATDLVYPRKTLSNEAALPTDFASVLRASLMRLTSIKAVCRVCNKTAIMTSRRVLSGLPVVLSINAAVHTEETIGYWISARGRRGEHKRPYLPLGVDVLVGGDGQVAVESVWEEGQERQDGAVRYLVRGMVAQIQGEKDAPHLVALERVQGQEWYLFNDFLVKKVSDVEARSITGAWKIPAVLTLEREDAASALDLSGLPTQIDTAILYQDLNISRRRDPATRKHELLDGESLGKGSLVAIDSEFVALSQEETEVRSDGTKKLIRPTRLSLARVSVVRGDGSKLNVPFIDDHIYTREPVVDYLTQFSGIVHGDLDPDSSRHTLVPLKTAYKKLRLLVDLGCRFIGHGLSKDFRIINIHVPPEQVIDTVDLYHSASHPRKLSLRFLSWFLLKRDIQSGTAAEGHDSVEDASAALQLYKLYVQFEADGRLDDVMEDLYDEGRRMNWRPPQAPTAEDPLASGTAGPAGAEPGQALR